MATKPRGTGISRKTRFDRRIAVSGAVIAVLSGLGTIFNSLWVNWYSTDLTLVQTRLTTVQTDQLLQEADIKEQADKRDYDLKVIDKVFDAVGNPSPDKIQVAIVLIDTVYDPNRKSKLAQLLQSKTQQDPVAMSRLADISKSADLERSLGGTWRYGVDWCATNEQNGQLATKVALALRGAGADAEEKVYEPTDPGMPKTPRPSGLELRYATAYKAQMLRLQMFLNQATGLDFTPVPIRDQPLRLNFIGIWFCKQ